MRVRSRLAQAAVLPVLVSNRPALVSGGDALIELVLPVGVHAGLPSTVEPLVGRSSVGRQ
jgi:hypothetical protein